MDLFEQVKVAISSGRRHDAINLYKDWAKCSSALAIAWVDKHIAIRRVEQLEQCNRKLLSALNYVKEHSYYAHPANLKGVASDAIEWAAKCSLYSD